MSIRGIVIECIGIANYVSIGVLCRIIKSSDKSSIMSEVVGFDKDIVLLMPYGDTGGIGAEDYVEVCNTLPHQFFLILKLARQNNQCFS